MDAQKSQKELKNIRRLEKVFRDSEDPLSVKLQNFPIYARVNHMRRFLSLYELFKLILNVKGSIVECGVYKGFSLMSWAKLSTILEPDNFIRKIYGFDTFSGF